MERILFTKYSNERAPRFSIRTDIIETDGVRWVRKQACDSKGKAHIANIHDSFVKLKSLFQGTRIEVNECAKLQDGNSVKLEFLKGKTLQEVLDGLLKSGNTDEFKKILKQYINLIWQTGTKEFVITEEFRGVFGEIDATESFRSAPITDIDMVLSNIFVRDDSRWTLIDYEWTFAFPIPIQFVIYRILHYYECGNAFRNQISDWDLYGLAGITEGEKEIFRKMEQSFQAYALGNYVPLRRLYPVISPGKTDLNMLLEHVEEHEKVQIFLSKDGVVREEDSCFYPLRKGCGKITLEIEEDISFIRLDPGEKTGKICIRKLEWDSGEACIFTTNGILESEREILFLEEDPQIYIEKPQKEKRVLHVEIYKDLSLDSYARQIMRDRKELESLKKQIQEKEEIITAMENTKIWKIYKKYRMMIKGERD